MRLRNECGSAYKTVTDKRSIEHLLAAGWHEVPEPVAVVEQATETVETAEAPKLVCEHGNSLMYKGRYLSQWVQVGKIKELRSALTYVGVKFDAKATKPELQQLLREYIKTVKADRKEGVDHDG